jgi:hypothetical protein
MKITGSGPSAGPSQRRRISGPGGERAAAGFVAELRELQIGLVEGWVCEGTLRRLAGLLDGLRPAIEDPNLDELLDELELRAAVELAKLGHGPM